jgi:two-component system chemotaxis sensor kinase CheA
MDPERLRGLFLSESRDHLSGAHELLCRLEQDPRDVAALRGLMRHAHSLKGMGATMGYPALVSLAHALEDEFERLESARASVDRDALVRMQRAMDRLSALIDDVECGADGEDRAAEAIAAELRSLAAASAARYRVSLDLAADEPARRERASRAVGVITRLAALGKVQRFDPPRLHDDPPRFDGRLELLLEYGGSAATLRRRIAELRDVRRCEVQRVGEVGRAPAAAGRAVRWTRVREDLLDAVAERASAAAGEEARLRECLAGSGDMEDGLRRLTLELRDLYGAVTELRLVPFSTIAHHLRRAVDELSAELDRPVRFRIEGAELRLDRGLLEALIDPLRHMVRNSLAHGFEARGERLARGKPALGLLRLRLQRESDVLVVSLVDDGRGIDAEAIRRAAVERRLLPPRRAAELDDRAALKLITLPGFSTAAQTDTISGRGVGMDAVRTAVEELGGRLTLDATPGRGTEITCRLPLSRALMQLLVVRSAGELFALPVAALTRTGPFRADAGQDGVWVYLDERLGLANPSPVRAGGEAAVLWCRQGAGEVGVIVDAVMGRRELLVEPLRVPACAAPECSGAAVLDGAGLVVVLEPYRLCSI